MKRLILVLIAFLVLAPQNSFAHPGRTDSSGGHTCRTNCDDWGLSYGEYHYHGGGYTTPNSAPSKPLILPSIGPSPKPSSTPLFIPEVSPSPEVMGETTEVSPSPTPIVEAAQTETQSGNAFAGFATLAVLGGGVYWIIKSIRNRFKKSVQE